MFIGQPVGQDDLLFPGALPVTNAPSTFTGTNFVGNTAQGGAGGLYGDAAGINGFGGGAVGGGLFNGGNATVTISGSAGGVSWGGWGRAAANGSFSGNRALGGSSVGIEGVGGEGVGGAIANGLESTMVVNQEQFSNNQAQGGPGSADGGDGGGGAILDAGAITITHSQFTGNIAVGGTSSGIAGLGFGGALGLDNFLNAVVVSAQVIDALFSGNGATGGASASGTTAGTGEGGAIAVLDATDTLNLISSQLTKNIATGGLGIAGSGTMGGTGLGGGLYNAGVSTLTGTSITSNRAIAGSPGGTGFGGGIYKDGGTLTLSANSKVTGNSATTADPNSN